MREEHYVKNYFKSQNTISQWWNPTEGDDKHIYKKIEDIIIKWYKQCYGITLEASCGKGRITRHLAKNQPYIGLDISREMLHIAQNKAPKATYIQGDAEILPIHTRSIDTIICTEAIVHYPNPETALKEFHRILKPEGTLIIDTDNKYSLRRTIKKVFSKQTLGADIYQSYSKKKIKKMLQNTGFKIEKIKYAGVISPTRIHTNKKIRTLINAETSFILKGLDHMPIIQYLSTYHIIKAKKWDK